MKICPNPDCKQPNADNAVFCSECGWELKSKPKTNILELYPNLNLTPTNFYNWRKPRGEIIIRILILLLFVLLLFSIGDLRFVPLFLFVFIIYFVFYVKKNFPKTELRAIADYVQKYHYSGFFLPRTAKRYVIFVKNGKFGVLEYVHYEVTLPAQYDYLEWHTKNKYLKVTANGDTFIMDVYGKKLI